MKNNIFEFIKFINNKSVALVCPSPHIIGKGYGKYIDSFDLVVRCNQFFKPTKEMIIDYGSRTNIMFFNPAPYNYAIIDKNGNGLANMKYINSLKYLVSTQIFRPEQVWSEFVELFRRYKIGFNQDKQNKLVIINDIIDLVLVNELDANPTTGYSALYFLLQWNVKKLFLTGMSFYNMGQWGETYQKDVIDNWIEYGGLIVNDKKNITKSEVGGEQITPAQKQIKHFYEKMLLKYKNEIELDEYLESWKDKYQEVL